MPKSESSQMSVGSEARSHGRAVAISWSEKVAGEEGVREGEFGHMH